ncbi:alpha/beta hydrolase [Aerococcaceae bacterium DSM 111020]|nr:alpha/beta hydrolase [Aerococcaceae bacterium DSM 111020]
MMERLEISTIKMDSLSLSASFFIPKKAIKGVILYFHGGGLIFGEKNDLPDQYVKLFEQAGYALVSFDYPLAPEVKLDQIIKSVDAQLAWYFEGGYRNIESNQKFPTFIMGRSAGAYLAILFAGKYQNEIEGLISFYGYYNLNDANFVLPSRHYLQYGKVSEDYYLSFEGQSPVLSGDFDERYIIYLSARQHGYWHKILLPPNTSAKDFSLTPRDLHNFPPTFITAGKDDPDVPSRQSVLMEKNISDAELHLVETNEHDFDRTQIEQLGVPIYQALIQWLNNYL